MTDITIGQRIAEQRKKLGISQEALGERMGVSRQAISKWEADGAVPEIDKLIAMSRLFGVSVGWLLGVEKESDSAREEELTEKQLRMIEEIVRRYQPVSPIAEETAQQKNRLWFRFLAVTGIAAAVILSITALVKIRELPNYDHQLNNISANYYHVQDQLGNLSWQLEQLAQGEKLLTEHSFSVEAEADLQGVVVHFQCTPRQWREGDTGTLVVRWEGKEMTQAQCRFSGSTCSASVSLEPLDGYSYCFVQNHADGSREQQLLENGDYYSANIAQGLKLQWDAGFSWTAAINRLTLDTCQVYLAPPALLAEEQELKWESVQLQLYMNDRLIDQWDVLQQESLHGLIDKGPYLNKDFWVNGQTVIFSREDRLSAVVKAELSNGMTFEKEVAAWSTPNGEFIEQEAPMAE